MTDTNRMKWYEYEDLINSALIKSWKKFLLKVINALHNLKNAIIYNKYVTSSIKKGNEFVKSVPGTLQRQTHNVQDIYRAFNGRELYSNLSKYTKSQMRGILNNIANSYKELDNKLSILVVILTVSTLMFFKSSIMVFTKTLFNVSPERSVASVGTSGNEMKNRPEYYGLHKKIITVHNISVPILITKKLKVHSVNLDVTLTCSNRYTRELIDSKPHLIHDKINKSFAPILTDFPITEEGKEIIRKKIKLEINNLLKELEIPGNIQKVTISHILSS